MRRREFLVKSAKATAVAALSGATGLYFHNRAPAKSTKPVLKTTNFEVPKSLEFPVVALATSADHARALRESLGAIGGVSRFMGRGERVTIKPNIGWDRAPEQAADTNPVLVAEMVRLCLEAGAAEVIVSDISCNDPRRCFLRSGIGEAAEAAGARVLLPEDQDYVDVDMQGELLQVWPVLKHFLYADRLINMAITKQHSLTSCTLGMKNLYGILGGRRNQLHQNIDQSIVDLATFCRPTLTIIDATRVLTHGGPQGGSLDYVEVHDSVICATDQVAADARAAEFLGLAGDRVGHIRLAERSGLGVIDYRTAGYKEIVV